MARLNVLFNLLKPYKWYIVSVLFLTLAGILFELSLPILLANIVDFGIVEADFAYIGRISIFMLLFSILAILFTLFSNYMSTKTATIFSRDLRRALFVKVESLPLEQFNRYGPPTLITRTTNDIRQVQDVLTMLLSTATRAPLMLVGGIVLAINREPQLALVFLISLPIITFAIIIVFRKAIPLFGLLQKRTDRLNLVVREYLTGSRLIRAYNRVSTEEKRFDVANDAFKETGIKVNRIISFLFPFMQLVFNFTNIGIVWFGAILISNNIVKVGNLMAFLQYAMMILMALMMISMAFVMIPRAQASLKRVKEILDIDNSNESINRTKTFNEELPILSFEDVSFYYQDADKSALNGVSFTIQKGETIAIIGGTGAGKSTLMNLIPKLYEPNNGTIKFKGVNFKDIGHEEIRNNVAYVPQQASLFSGTIRDNITLKDTSISDEAVYKVLSKAQALDFVKVHFGGLSRQLNQAGQNLSGGQKQRLMIARALIKDVDIYIFDDSFSALDYKTDRRLRNVLNNALKDKTKIIVSQRIQSIKDADKIIVLHDGRIAGIGRHNQLLKESTVYQEIVMSQEMGGAQ